MWPSARSLRLVPVLVCATAISAQTYTPKTIRLQGADGMDQAQILHLIDIAPGTPVTKGQIEAAMQRLADSGAFTDLSYTVDSAALVFLLKPAAGTQIQPARFSNFVWWQPGALEPLVEARVPLFHGQLPLTGELTTQVEAALTALLAQQGVPGATVEAMQSATGARPTVALRITAPAILVGTLHLTGVASEAAKQMQNVTARLSGGDFDFVETATDVVNNTVDTHHNAGFLDATVDAPVFAPPRKEGNRYLVDGSATVHAGAMYRIAQLTFEGVDPKLLPSVKEASGLKVGDPAQEMTLHIGEGLVARSFANQGMLEAKATAQVSKDPAAHTVTYRMGVMPGPAYTLASVDTTALAPAMQARFDQGFHGHAGQLADAELRQQMVRALNAAGVPRQVNLQQRLNRSAHTVTYVVQPQGVHALGRGEP